MKKIIVLLIALIINLSNTADCSTEKVFLTEEEIAREILFEKEPVDVREARTQAFKNVEYEIDPKTFEKYLKDKKFVAPPKEYGGKPKLKHRLGVVEFLSNNIYCVLYYKDILCRILNYKKYTNLYSFYYEYNTGKLIYINKDKLIDDNNLLLYFYNSEGKLVYIKYLHGFEEQKIRGYLFNNKKEYIAYFNDDILYDLNGNEIMRTVK